ncbi:hypothetical protein C8J57DRAFT_1241547 [Mycena rebaudengoi]|nr:hypothetical protein C8J57DRAFT_1241547 [Mycena rebaudengoi]
MFKWRPLLTLNWDPSNWTTLANITPLLSEILVLDKEILLDNPIIRLSVYESPLQFGRYNIRVHAWNSPAPPRSPSSLGRLLRILTVNASKKLPRGVLFPCSLALSSVRASPPSNAVLVLSNTCSVRLLDAARAPEDTQERASRHDTVRLYSSPPLRSLHLPAPLLPPTYSKPLQENVTTLCTAALPRTRKSSPSNFCAPLSNNLRIETQDECGVRSLIISASHLRAPCLHYAFFSSTALSAPVPRTGTPTSPFDEGGRSACGAYTSSPPARAPYPAGQRDRAVCDGIGMLWAKRGGRVLIRVGFILGRPPSSSTQVDRFSDIQQLPHNAFDSHASATIAVCLSAQFRRQSKRGEAHQAAKS